MSFTSAADRDSRRRALQWIGASGLALALSDAVNAADPATFRLATFAADVTVPLGHGMMGGSWQSKSVADPLEARGIVLLGTAAPVVFVSVDWCEIRNDAYRDWQRALAKAAGTTPERVLISTVHQHDAPVADLEAERILRTAKAKGSVCDVLFHDKAVAAVADSVREAIKHANEITHFGTGQAKVDQLASNRRYVSAGGAVRWDRTSASRHAEAIAADEGLIDPWLKTLSFWNQDAPIAALSFYAVHPMSYYGSGDVSADFPGIARRARQKETPGAFQIYCSGASGNVTAGKYNTGAKDNRPVLAKKLQDAMAAAWKETKRQPLTQIDFRVAHVMFEPRGGAGFTPEDLEQQIAANPQPFQQCLAAMGLSWRKRLEEKRPIELPVIDLGGALMLLLPGEAYVEFQLAAQKLRPDAFVCTAGYGDGGTGYIPTAMHVKEGDTNLSDWCWVAEGAEEKLSKGMQEVLGKDATKM